MTTNPFKFLDDLVTAKRVPAYLVDNVKSIAEINGGDITAAIMEARKNMKEQHFNKVLNTRARETLFRSQDEADDPSQLITSTLTKNLGDSNGLSNVEYRGKAIQGMVQTDFVDAMNALRSTRLGFKRDENLADSIIHALYGRTTDPQATAYAAKWSEISDRLLKWFNKRGGNISKLEGWNLPQSHNPSKMFNMGKEAWVTYTKDLLDLEEMSKRYGNLENIDDILRDVFDTITSGGMNKVEIETGALSVPEGTPSNLIKRHRDARFLYFKDAESWLDYSKTAGNPDVFSTMMDHIRFMSQEIAMVEILGPNAEANFKDMQTRAIQQGKQGDVVTKNQQSIFDVVSGRVDENRAISTGDEWLAKLSGGFRDIQTGSKLGSAMVSAVTDPVFAAVTAGYDGLDVAAILTKGYADALKEMSSLAPTERTKMAARLGIVSDAFQGTLANSRYAESSNGFLSTLSGGVLRASGLNSWTNAWRATFSLEFLGKMGDSLGQSLDSLGGFGKTLKKYGFTEEDWANISRVNPINDSNEGRFFDAKKLQRSHPDLAIRVLEMVNEELDYAVIMPDARIRALTTGGAAKGTLKGEMSRLFWMFKSFPMTVIATHIGRLMYGKMNTKGRIAYAAALFTGTTAMGIVSLQLRDALKGKEPREVTPGVVVQGAMQGGALGIFGDLIFQDTTRYGNGLAATFMGPAIGVPENIYDMIMGNLQKKLQGKDTDVGLDAARLIQSNIPGQNLWYTRLLFERFVFDNVKAIVDPNYHRRIDKHTRDMKKNYNQEWWWKPND